MVSFLLFCLRMIAIERFILPSPLRPSARVACPCRIYCARNAARSLVLIYCKNKRKGMCIVAYLKGEEIQTVKCNRSISTAEKKISCIFTRKYLTILQENTLQFLRLPLDDVEKLMRELISRLNYYSVRIIAKLHGENIVVKITKFL